MAPVLLLPEHRDLSAGELDMALAHELAHLRRGDLWWGCIPALARHLFFFHPLVHMAVREYALAREADCDRAVVRSGHFSRYDYGSLLLRLGTPPRADGELAMASSTFHALSRRLAMLQKTSFLPRGGALAIVAAVCTTGVMPLRLVAAAAADPPGAAASVRSGITSIEFGRSLNGPDAGRVIVDFEKEQVPVTLGTHDDGRIVVDFAGVELPAHLHRRFDVSDAGTAVKEFDAVNTANGARLLIATTTRDIELRPDRSGTHYELEIQSARPVQPDRQPAAATPAPVFTGERMSVSFERIPTRTLLLLIAETGSRKIILDDSIAGYVSLKVSDVPWDQLLDTVLTMKGLGMRIQGDTMFVATREVLDRQE